MGRGACIIGVVSACAFGVVASCREPTQVTITLKSDEPCERMSPVNIIVGGDAAQVQTRYTTRFTTALAKCESGGAIGTLVLTPDGNTASVLVAVGIATDTLSAPDPLECFDPETAKRCIVARRVISFVSHRSLDLPIVLDPLCIGESCDPASTCYKGHCVDASVACSDDECLLPDEAKDKEAAARDASSSDGAYDAPLSDGSFDDSSFDANDGSLIDGAGNPDGNGLPMCAKIGGNGASAYAVCYEMSAGGADHGVFSNGDCPVNFADASAGTNFCCHCACPYGAHQAVSCTTGSDPGSCNPTNCGEP